MTMRVLFEYVGEGSATTARTSLSHWGACNVQGCARLGSLVASVDLLRGACRTSARRRGGRPVRLWHSAMQAYTFQAARGLTIIRRTAQAGAKRRTAVPTLRVSGGLWYTAGTLEKYSLSPLKAKTTRLESRWLSDLKKAGRYGSSYHKST